MRIILLDNIAQIGKKWEIHDVSDGYARNVLIPQGLAEPATATRIKQAEVSRQASSEQAEESLRTIQELASALDGFEVTVYVRANASGDLYAAVTPRQIADALNGQGHEVPLKAIQMRESIKRVGEYPISISLDHGLETQIQLIVEEMPEEAATHKSEAA